MPRSTATLYGPLPAEVAAALARMVTAHARTPLSILAGLQRRLLPAAVESPADRWGQLMLELFPQSPPSVDATPALPAPADLTPPERRIVGRLLVAVSTFLDGEAMDLYLLDCVPEDGLPELIPVFHAADALRDAYRPEVLQAFLPLLARADAAGELPTP